MTGDIKSEPRVEDEEHTKPLWIKALMVVAVLSVVAGVVGMILIASTANRMEEPQSALE